MTIRIVVAVGIFILAYAAGWFMVSLAMGLGARAGGAL